MRRRQFIGVAALGVPSVCFARHRKALDARARRGWNLVPSIAVVSADSDPRLPLVDDAVAFWNNALSELGTPFRLGIVTRVVGAIPIGDLRGLSANLLSGRLPIRGLPESIRRIDGNIVVALSDGDFISFTSFGAGDRVVVAIKDYRSYPLTLPNVARNVIAHELGHALGLWHNSDPTALMCGRPAPCRPDLFASDRPRYFRLTEADKVALREMYPPDWTAAG